MTICSLFKFFLSLFQDDKHVARAIVYINSVTSQTNVVQDIAKSKIGIWEK